MPTQFVCHKCGKTFNRPASTKAKFCSRKCFGEWHGQYMTQHPSNPRNKITRICEQCGKVFKIWPSVLSRPDKKPGRFCSRDCQHAFKRTVRGKSHPLYKEGDHICEWCGKTYRTRAVLVRKGRTHFCSRICQGAYTSHHIGRQETSIEKIIRLLLDRLALPYVQEKQMGVFICDFIITKYRLAIECDGDYWHGSEQQKAKDNRKDNWLIAHGYTVIRLPEQKIMNDLPWCTHRIIEVLPHWGESSSGSPDVLAGSECPIQMSLLTEPFDH